VAFELVFETTVVNSYLIYRDNYTAGDITILQFHEGLVRSLLLGKKSEVLKPEPRQKPRREVRYNSAEHKLQEKGESARDVRRRCAGCYEKIRQEESREASAAAAKKVKTFCAECGKFFCLASFTKSIIVTENDVDGVEAKIVYVCCLKLLRDSLLIKAYTSLNAIFNYSRYNDTSSDTTIHFTTVFIHESIDR
jgi:hypothetical protein